MAIEETAAAAVGDRLYVIGGFDSNGASLTATWVFDGTSWAPGPALPLGLDHASAATLNGSVYVAGGHGFGADSARVFRLDGEAWHDVAPMKSARGGHALVVLAGRLYALGGNTAAGDVGPAEVYDPNVDTWSTIPAVPVPRNHVSGFVWQQMACIAGGRAPTTARVDCFDPSSTTWKRGPELPQSTSGAGAVTLGDGEVMLMGGQDAGESVMVDEVARLQPGIGGTWTLESEGMRVVRHGFALALYGGRGWACGGATAPGLHPVTTCTSVA